MLTSKTSKPLLALATAAPLALGLAACGDPEPISDGGNDGGMGCNTQTPFVDDWDVVFDGPLAAELEGDNASLNVTNLTIGGTVVEDNFLNRGDIEIYYTLPPIDGSGVGTIRVEMQRFTGACDAADAQEKFDAMQPWIYSATSIAPPGELEEEDVCDPEVVFYNGCQIRSYYEGLTQPARDGVNFRVYLPENYRGTINAITEDNIWPEGNYFKRSNVTVVDLYGSATIQLEQGEANVRLAPDILPAPYCFAEPGLNEDANQGCEDYVDDATMMPAPWDKDCGCVDKLGKVDVKTTEPNAANITVDAPSDFWTTINATNQQPAPTKDDSCLATVKCGEFDECEKDASRCIEDEPWRCAALTNVPAGALAGTGYSLKLTSSACSDVSFHQSSGDFGADAEIEQRGDLTVCSGCLSELSAP